MKNRTQREERQKRQGLPYGLLILAMLIFGTNGLLVSRISVQSSQIVLLRTLIGGALLSVIVLLRGGFDRNAVRADLPMLLLGGTALGLNWVALFGAYRLLNVSLATLIYYIGPILVLLFSPLLFREKLTAVKMAAVIVVAVGLVCISGSILSGGMNLTGLLTAVASALFYAALIVFNKRITHTQGLQTAAIELDIAFRGEDDDIDLIERRSENIRPEGPTIVGDVVIAYYREERVNNLVIRVSDRILVLVIPVLVSEFIQLDVVLVYPTALALLEQGIQCGVVFRLGICHIPEMSVEKVVVPQADFQHFVHAARVGRQVAVGTDQETIVAEGGQDDQVVHMILVIKIRHLDAVLHGRSGHQDTQRADLVAGGQREDNEGEDVYRFFHLTKHI